MKIIDRYLLREYLRNMLLITLIFVFLFLTIDFFEKIRMFLSNNATLKQMLAYSFWQIPIALSQMLPAVVLLSALITFGNLSRHSEIIALKANGISLFRFALPVLGISALTSLAVFFLNESITPYAYARAEHIRYVEVQKRPSPGSFNQGQIWYRGEKGIYNFRIFDAGANSLEGITLYYLDRQMNLLKRLDAKRGEWKDGKWLFYDLLITRFDGGDFPVISRANRQTADIPETPSDFKLVQKDAEAMGYFELKRYINKLQAEGYNATRYIVELQGKIAFPLISIILFVIGFSFSLRSERSGGIALGIGTGLIIGFSYWIVFAFGISLGRSGALSPIFAAWFANILFGLGSLFLLSKVRS
ncbi:MAG: LPS export ABC transporter permease LptG [Syntrophales bacterium]